MIVGRCVEEPLDTFLLDACKSKDVQIIYKNDFVSMDEYESVVAQSDWIMALHVNFYWSSGTIGHAAAHGKGLIATSQGLIGRLVKEHQLGLVADPFSSTEIAAQLEKAITSTHSASDESKQFNDSNSAQEFIRSLLSAPPSN